MHGMLPDPLLDLADSFLGTPLHNETHENDPTAPRTPFDRFLLPALSRQKETPPKEIPFAPFERPQHAFTPS